MKEYESFQRIGVEPHRAYYIEYCKKYPTFHTQKKQLTRLDQLLSFLNFTLII